MKILNLALTIALAIGVSACGQNNDKEKSSSKKPSSFRGLWMPADFGTELRETGKLEKACAEKGEDLKNFAGAINITNTGKMYMYVSGISAELAKQIGDALNIGKIDKSGVVKYNDDFISESEKGNSFKAQLSKDKNTLSIIVSNGEISFPLQYLRTTKEEIQKFDLAKYCGAKVPEQGEVFMVPELKDKKNKESESSESNTQDEESSDESNENQVEDVLDESLDDSTNTEKKAD